MRLSSLSALFMASALIGCGTDTQPPPNNPPPNNPPPNNPPPNNPPPNSPPPQNDPIEIPGGVVTGVWNGEVAVKGNITVAQGQTLTIFGGSVVTFSERVKMTVAGTLSIDGSAGMVRMIGDSQTWAGLDVSGTLMGSGLEMRDGGTCILGAPGSTIELSAAIIACNQAFNLRNGAQLNNVRILGGSTNIMGGGTLVMTDSVIDFRHPALSPDCLLITGGGAQIDHSQITGCHCPFHISGSSEELVVTNSLIDGAAYPVMIANSNARFTGNNFVASRAHLQDIGGNINADIADNYFEGGAAILDTRNPGQFTGSDQYAREPFAEAGPR